MPRIMADNDVLGQFEAIVRFLRAPPWQAFWEGEAISIVTMSQVGLDRNASDAAIWETCQREQIVLFTANRNKEGPDSLEQALRASPQSDSLPVITLSDPIRFRHDRG
jgi:hypothetical protein